MKNLILGISISANILLVLKVRKMEYTIREYMKQEDYNASLAPYKVEGNDSSERRNNYIKNNASSICNSNDNVNDSTSNNSIKCGGDF